MKKRLALALSLVALLLASLGGGVYAANPHGPAPANKLVGLGDLGTTPSPMPGDSTAVQDSKFFLNNPDSVNEITITQVSIIRGDGSVVYQGPFIRVNPPTNEREVVTELMTPHQVRVLHLGTYMWTGGGNPEDLTDPDNWLTSEEASAQLVRGYTVEILWQPTTKSPTCPLIGWCELDVEKFSPSGESVGFSVTRYEMVNMTQGGH